VSSFANGIAQLDKDTGAPIRYLGSSAVRFPEVSALAGDNGSLWYGYRWLGGVSRYQGGSVQHFGEAFGETLFNSPVTEVQVRSATPAVSNRFVLVGFGGYKKKDGTVVPGAVGVYRGN